MRSITLALVPFLLVLAGPWAQAKQIQTNAVTMAEAPEWLKTPRVEKVTDRIQQKLEWTIRRIDVRWYTKSEDYERAHRLGPLATAVTVHSNGISVVHMGPRVDTENFDEVFGHELVHVIINQKYKDSIPKWLEEGLANHIASRGKVDYKWLAKQPFPNDVKELAHPFSGTISGISYRYKASQAFAEMLAKRCDLYNLIRLSVQRKMEDYMVTYCEIKDLNAAFRDWVKKKSTGL